MKRLHDIRMSANVSVCVVVIVKLELPLKTNKVRGWCVVDEFKDS